MFLVYKCFSLVLFGVFQDYSNSKQNPGKTISKKIPCKLTQLKLKFLLNLGYLNRSKNIQAQELGF